MYGFGAQQLAIALTTEESGDEGPWTQFSAQQLAITTFYAKKIRWKDEGETKESDQRTMNLDLLNELNEQWNISQHKNLFLVAYNSIYNLGIE